MAIEENFPDMARLCERCEVFHNLINDPDTEASLDTDDSVESVLSELGRVFKSILNFINDNTDREEYSGITEFSYRLSLIADLAKYTHSITRLSEQLNVAAIDSDSERRRGEDFEDAKQSFSCAIVLVLDEVSSTPEQAKKVEKTCNSLLKDIQHFEETVQKTLSCFKHYPLTVVESRGLKGEIKRLSTMVSERRDEILLESLRHVPINYEEIDGSEEEHDRKREEGEEERYDEDPVNIDPGDQEDDNYEDMGSISGLKGLLTAQAMDRLTKDTPLSAKDSKRRQKALEEMRLPLSDVSISSTQLGRGGRFGEVFLGNFKNRYRVAVKTVKKSTNNNGKAASATDAALKSLENEVLLMKYLGNYPTILTCYGFISTESSCSIVLELAPYGSLESILRDTVNYPALPLSLLIAWLCDLADALKFLHSKEIKHRDVKAENLLVFERFRVKLSDFGPAKPQPQPGNAGASTAAAVSASLSFMAPEIRVGGAAEFASDIFSFAMTAVQLLTRKTPKIDDFKGQISSCLFTANIPHPEVNDILSALLLSCVNYDAKKNQNELRPSAAIVANDMNQVLLKLGGDPRDSVEMLEMMNDLETITRRLEAERLLRNNTPASPPRLARTSSTSPTPMIGESGGVMMSYSNLARKNSSNAYSSFIRVPSNSDFIGMSEKIPSGFNTPPPLMHSSSSIGLFEAGGGSAIGLDPTAQDAEDKAILTAFFVDHFRYSQFDAQSYADILVKNGVSSVEALRRRCNRNKDYLLNLGFDSRISNEVLRVILNSQTTGKFFDKSVSQSVSYYQINNNNNTSAGSVHSGETSSNLSSIDNNNNHNKTMINNNNNASTREFYPLSQQHNQDLEDRNSLVKFFTSQIHCDQNIAMRSADMLMRNGVPTIEVLVRRLGRENDFLLNIGFEESLAQDVSDYFVTSPNCRMSKNLSSSSLSNIMMAAGGERSLGNRRNSSTISMILRSEHLPTEISRLYYDATQCNNRDALLKLMHIADNGDNLAQGFVMRMYALGQGGLQKDLLAAQELGTHLLPWLQSAIESSNDLTSMYARYLIGVCYSEGLGTKKDIREALRWYRMSAEQGYAAAQAYIGFAYYSGVGVVQNLQEAVKWYHLAADQGYAAAQCNLGLCYEHGYGTKKSPENAVKWYKAGAEQGDAASLYNLAHCLEHGIGVAASMEKAFTYYLQSAELGYTSSQYKVGYCYYAGEGAVQNLDCAVAWFRASALKGYAPAQCKLGLCYENGHGVEKQLEKAAEWYRLSADQGHPPALYYLGYLYYSGNGVTRSVDEAVKLYKAAAEKGYAAAQNNLGFCYFNGVGVQKNLPTAVQWYKKAAEQDYPAAQYNLGYCYEKGYGVAAKLNELLKWYRLAAANGNEKAKLALQRLET